MSFDIRSFVLAKPAKIQPITTPFWSHVDENGVEQVDGFVALRDMPTADLSAFQKVIESAPLSGMSAIIARALIDTRTGAQIFPDADRDALMSIGFTEWAPLAMAAQKFFGLTQEALNAALADAKKNLETLPTQN